MGSVGIAEAKTTTDLLFDTFVDGHALFQAHDGLAREVAVAEGQLVSTIRNGRIGSMDQLGEDPPVESLVLQFPDCAQEALALLIGKARLERASLALTNHARSASNLFTGRKVHVETIDPYESPITKYYFSDAPLGGSRRYEPSEFYRQKANGSVVAFDFAKGALWVERKRRRFAGAPDRWRVAMPTETGREPLVRVEFIN